MARAITAALVVLLESAAGRWAVPPGAGGNPEEQPELQTHRDTDGTRRIAADLDRRNRLHQQRDAREIPRRVNVSNLLYCWSSHDGCGYG